MHFWCSSSHLGEEADDGITFNFRHPDNLGHEARVEEETVPAGDGVRPHQGMLRGDGIASDWSAQGPRVGGLHVRRVQCSEAFEVVLHMWRKGVVGCILR